MLKALRCLLALLACVKSKRENIMMIDFVWNSGLVFGIEHDVVHVTETEEELDLDGEPNSMILLHLGIITISFIFM